MGCVKGLRSPPSVDRDHRDWGRESEIGDREPGELA
jgi:hypothetical protein